MHAFLHIPPAHLPNPLLRCGLTPQVLLLHELGLRTSDFDRLAESRPEIFQMGIVTMRRKLKFLQDTIGLRWAGTAHSGSQELL